MRIFAQLLLSVELERLNEKMYFIIYELGIITSDCLAFSFYDIYYWASMQYFAIWILSFLFFSRFLIPGDNSISAICPAHFWRHHRCPDFYWISEWMHFGEWILSCHITEYEKKNAFFDRLKYLLKTQIIFNCGGVGAI